MSYREIKRRSLKVNVKSLAAEARVIRCEERKCRNDEVRGCLHWHRVGHLRREARIALLSYALIRGVPYRAVEVDAKREPDWKRVEKKAEKFSLIIADIESRRQWIAEAKEYFASKMLVT